jgi:hypothetical protein
MWMFHLQPGETQKPIPGWSGYFVTDLGRVFSYKRQGFGTSTVELERAPKELKITRARVGRYQREVPICSLREGRDCRWAPHVGWLVLQAFVGPKPPGKVMCHEDDNPFNCKLSNLRYDTQLANMADARRNGIAGDGELAPSSILTDAQAKEIRESDDIVSVLAVRFKVSRKVIENIKRGRTYRSAGGVPRYTCAYAGRILKIVSPG